MSYPKMLYHATQGAVIVPDEAAAQSLPDGWSNTPPESVTSVAPVMVRLSDLALKVAPLISNVAATVDIPEADEAKRKPGRPRKASD